MKHDSQLISRKTARLCCATAAIAQALAFSASAQYAPPPPPAPFPGFINEWLRKDDPYKAAWDIGGSVRLRYEVKENGGAGFGVAANPAATPPAPPAPSGADFRAVVGGTPFKDNDNSYFLSKVRMRLGYTDEWYNFLVEGRSSESAGDDRRPEVERDGPVDLHQAYAFIGNHKEFPLSLKIGRQELSYGDERLVGAFAWNNVGRVFDAAKVRWQNQYFSADFFASKVVIPRDDQFNMANEYDWFSGMYGSTKLIPKQTTEFYFLARNTAADSPILAGVGTPAAFNGPSERDIYTVGLRMKSTPGEFGGWDYGLELAGQFGSFTDLAITNVASRDLDHLAFAAIAQVGYTWTSSSMTPRVGLEYAFGSGDSDPRDGDHGTFENLFPTNHKFYGYMDFLSLQNIHDLRLIYTMKPLPRMSVALEYHSFWLVDTSDNLYNVGGVRRGGLGNPSGGPGTGYGINSSFSSYVGSEIDFVVGYALTKYAALEAGYGHFFVGNYIDQSLSNVGGSTDADWFYMQTTFTF